MHYFSLFISILISVGGQIAIKAGSLTAEQSRAFALFHPYVIFGLCLYFISLLFYIYSLRQIPLSTAVPCISISYVLVALIAHFLWNEPFGMQHIMAFLLILSGVFLLIKA